MVNSRGSVSVPVAEGEEGVEMTEVDGPVVAVARSLAPEEVNVDMTEFSELYEDEEVVLPPGQVRRMHTNTETVRRICTRILLFCVYGSSCASNGKDAHTTPDTIPR
eukprot:175634-Prorocentrum_minimum.AAC.1